MVANISLFVSEYFLLLLSMIMFKMSWHWEDAERIQLEMGGRAITQIDPSVTIYSNGTERNEYLLHSHQYFT